MKLTSTRFRKMKEKLRERILTACNNQTLSDTTPALKRLNRVIAIQRARNLANGMPGEPWINTTAKETYEKYGRK